MDFTTKLFKVYERFSVECPFFFEFLQRSSFVGDVNQKLLMRLEVIDGHFYIYYQPALWQSLTFDDLAIQIEHQILHVIFKHNLRGEFKDKNLFHTACDMIVNHNIKRVRDNYPTILKESSEHFMLRAPLIPLLFENQDFENQFRTAYGIDHLTVEKLYDFLEQRSDSWSPDCEVLDEVEFDISDNERAVIQAITAEIRKKLGSRMMIGFSPGVEQMVVKMAQPARRNYREIVREFVGDLKQDKRKSWSRVARRYPHQVAGKAREKKPLLCVVIDTSGSMGQEKILRKITSELLALRVVVKGIFVVAGDVEPTFSKKFTSKMNVSEIEFKGFGGTDLQFGWDFAKDNKCDGVICYTDGYLEDLDTRNLPSFFVLTQSGFLENEKFRNFPAVVMEFNKW
jgi:predicted metal-dependent peptidase